MSHTGEEVVAFGPFRLDGARRLLSREGTPVLLGARALEILLVLIRHAPNVVSKAALFEQVWPGTFIEESTLRFQMWTLRKALSDGEDGSRYISTVSGRGYCFVGPLSHPPSGATVEPAENGEARDRATASKSAGTNLPLGLTEIIGRERELIQLGEWLKLGRLVTVVGSGGVGKTRLAVELGWRVLGEFAAGVWLIDLASLADQESVPSAVATTLGISVTRTEATADSIVAALRKAHLLLILDNCEHLAESAAALIGTLLERVPSISILATSQKALHVTAEQVYALNPLAVPPADAVEIRGYAAVQLFARRARAADRIFELHDGNSVGIGAICRQLDGLPLALEMAAGRLRMLGVEGLRRGLDDRLKMLKGAPNSESRHASLHSMLEWSHSLLEPSDQTIFRRLAAFPASFSLESAVSVASEDKGDRWDIVDALEHLIDRSLVTVERSEPVRYRLLETLRLYAADKLRQSGEADVVAERHARHFTEVFGEAERCWEETPDPDWIARFQPELGNLRAALDWALAAPERRQLAIALAASGFALLRWLWLIGEGRRYLDRIIPLLGEDTTAANTARVLGYASAFYHFVRDPDGVAYAERSAAVYRRLGHAPGLANTLLTVAHYRMWQARDAEAKSLLLEARHLLEGGAFKKSRLRLMHLAGLAAHHANDIPNARRYLLEGLDSARTLRSAYQVVLLFNLGVCEYTSGNIDRAIELTSTALNRTNSFGHAYLGLILTNLGAYLIAKGQLPEARSRLQEALSILIETGNHSAADCLQTWAFLAGMEGSLLEAAQLIGFWDADRARRGQIIQRSVLPLYNRLMGILEAGLPSAELDTWKAMGARWSEAEAVEFVANRLLMPPARAA